MDIYVNNLKQAISEPDGLTVGHVLSALTEGRDDLVLVSVQFDGEQVGQDGLDEIVSRSLTEPGRLDAVLQTNAEIASAALYEAADMLSSDRRCYGEISADLAVRGLDESSQRLNDCFNNWVMAQQAFSQSLNAAGLNVANLPPELRVAELTRGLTETLGAIQQRLKDRDSVAVADLLEHELAAVADGWIDLCNMLAEAIHPRKD